MNETYAGFCASLAHLAPLAGVAIASRIAGSDEFRCAYAFGRTPERWSSGRCLRVQLPELAPTPLGVVEVDADDASGGSGSDSQRDTERGWLLPLSWNGSLVGAVAVWLDHADAERAVLDPLMALVAPLAATLSMASAEVNRREVEARHEAVLSALVDGVVTISADGIITSVNQSALRILGFSEDDLVGQNVSMIMPEPFASEHDSYIQRYLDTGEAHIIGRGREAIARRSDGTTLTVELAVSEVQAGKRRSFAGVLRDITRRKRAETALQQTLEELRGSQAQLIHAEKMSSMGTMVAGVAHELNNPMMSILNFTQYCLKRTAQDDKRYPVLHDMEHEIQRCIHIVKGLLSFSRPHSSPDDACESTDLRGVFGRVRSSLAYRIDHEAVSVFETSPHPVPQVWVRPSEIEQVLVALLVNALDSLAGAHVEKPTVALELRHVGAEVELRLADNGPGIAAGTLPRIFDPFFTTKPVGQGTGLGLSIAHGIVRSHQGTLTCESEPGSGTTFILKLPVAQQARRGSAP